MNGGGKEILVLKPTTVFLAFLASQLPEKEWPSLKLLQTDNTAYVIPKHEEEEKTLQEIEKRFSLMFRHEMSRWLGEGARNKMESSFLDFLCCFKFEMHAHVIWMDSCNAGPQLLNLKPRSMLLKWIQSEVAAEKDLVDLMEKVSLVQVAENSTLIVKKFSDLNQIKLFLNQYYKLVYETLMTRMCGYDNRWPMVNSFKKFCHYFEVEIHTQLIDLPC